ncbi:MAG: hypothetical protein QOF60_1940 [Actinomycetota bacterium]|jgi:hypothetical protein|nr:hypothetical protein [Actinomycetota bacterium]
MTAAPPSPVFATRLVEALRATFEDMTAPVADAMLRATPEYRSVPPGELLAAVDGCCRMVVGAAAGRCPTADQLGDLRALGARWAVLLTVAHTEAAFVAAEEVVFVHLMDQAALLGPTTPPEHAAVTMAAVRVRRTVAEALRAVCDGLVEGEARQRHPPRTQRAVAFVDRVLTSHLDDLASLRGEARRLGLEPYSSDWGLLGVVGRSGCDTAVLRGAASEIAEATASAVEGPVRMDPAPHAVVLVELGRDVLWERVVEAAEPACVRADGFLVASSKRCPFELIGTVYKATYRSIGYAPLGAGATRVKVGALEFHRTLAESPPVQRGHLFVSVFGEPPYDEALLRILDALVAFGTQERAAAALGVTTRTLALRGRTAGADRLRLERPGRTGVHPGRRPLPVAGRPDGRPG